MSELYKETKEELQDILNISENEAEALLQESYMYGTMNRNTAVKMFGDEEVMEIDLAKSILEMG